MWAGKNRSKMRFAKPSAKGNSGNFAHAIKHARACLPTCIRVMIFNFFLSRKISDTCYCFVFFFGNHIAGLLLCAVFLKGDNDILDACVQLCSGMLKFGKKVSMTYCTIWLTWLFWKWPRLNYFSISIPWLRFKMVFVLLHFSQPIKLQDFFISKTFRRNQWIDIWENRQYFWVGCVQLC